jgi:hypothetical protein
MENFIKTVSDITYCPNLSRVTIKIIISDEGSLAPDK